MAVIHHTVLKPTKLELLTAWLPTRPWYEGGGAGGPELAKAGGFRLDDPEGEVGIEFMMVADTSGPEPVTYLVPFTYRGAPLDGAEGALVGTMEHGVLGKRWAYDGCHDPVLVAQLLALIEGRVEAQAQSATDTPDREVTASFTGEGPLAGEFTDFRVVDEQDGTVVTAASGAQLRLHRVLRVDASGADGVDGVDGVDGAVGEVSAPSQAPDGSRPRHTVVTLPPARNS